MSFRLRPAISGLITWSFQNRENQDAAMLFINFMLKPENALKNAEYVGYSTPNLPAKEMLPEETKEDKSFYPDADTMKHLEVYEKFDHKWTGKYSDLFPTV